METVKGKFDPRVKLIVVIYLTTLGVFTKDIYNMIYILGVSVLLSYISKVDIVSSIGKLKRIFYVVLLIIIIQSIFSFSEQVIFSLGPIRILTVEGVMRGVEFLFRISIIVVSASILSTSSSREIIQGLIQMKVPYEIAFMVSIGIRFLPMLSEELKDVFVALQLRGIELNKLSFRKKVSLYSFIFTPVIIRTINKAQKLSISMDSKGFRTMNTRTSYKMLKMKRNDYLYMIIGIACGSISFLFKFI